MTKKHVSTQNFYSVVVQHLPLFLSLPSFLYPSRLPNIWSNTFCLEVLGLRLLLCMVVYLPDKRLGAWLTFSICGGGREGMMALWTQKRHWLAKNRSQNNDTIFSMRSGQRSFLHQEDLPPKSIIHVQRISLHFPPIFYFHK